ncbi:MAG TPA: MG2 domain-containing protein, partial [Polyangia bacterium]|nr:MG2 domain-containing protein [Polyangia bacterium]
MRARWALSALAIASAVTTGCGPKVKPGLGVVGEKTVARFDRAMVAADKIGSDVSEAPVRMKPVVPGKFRWLDARTLTFVADDKLPRSTHFELEARAGTTALDGFGLAKAVTWSFETERLHVNLASPGRWATPDQRIAVSFNQPVRRSDVEKRCAYLSDRDHVAAVVDNTGETEDARERFTVLPHGPLAFATKWRFECNSELTGAEGPLTVQQESDKNVSRVEFETYGPLRVIAVKPRGSQISPDEGALVITFSNPVAATAAALPIKIQPEIEGFPQRAAVVDDRVSYTMRALRPNTRYTISVDASIADRFGQRLAGPYVAEFSTGDGTPRLDIETGAWVVEATRAGYSAWARNLTKIEADVTAVPDAKLGQLAGQLDWWDTEALDARKVGLRTKHVTIPIKGRQNQWDQIQIEPAKLLGSAAPPTGFYYVALRAPEEPHPGAADPRPRELLLNFTNLGVTAKLSGPSGLVWVTRLSDGQPQPGAEVAIRDAKGKIRWRGTTDADGLAVTPGQAQLLPKDKRAQRNHASAGEAGEGEGEGEGDFAEGDFAMPHAADMMVFARFGKDTTWVNPERIGGLAAWNFHVPVDASARAEQLRGFLHTDRGLYRPGDTVRVKGLARVMKLGSALHVPSSRKATVVVRDPRGEQVLEKKVALSRFGGFAVDVPLGEGARLGDYRVEASMGEGVFHERFSVEQYRTASFEVKVPQPAHEPIAGEELKLTAEANYLYGAPLRGGSLTWKVYRRSRPISFPKLPGYDFTDERQWQNWYDSRSAASEPLVEENEQRLDKNGRGKISLRLKREDFQTAQDIMVTAEVQDETHQTIAANVAIPAHQAGVYFGIDRGSPIGEAKG